MLSLRSVGGDMNAMRATVFIGFWMVLIDAVCVHYGLEGWTTVKAMVILGPILAGLSFILAVKPVWVINR